MFVYLFFTLVRYRKRFDERTERYNSTVNI